MFNDYMDFEDGDLINRLRDVMYVNGLRFEDILKTMNLTRDSAPIDFFTLRDGIRRIDPSLTANQAKILAATILDSRDQITVFDMIECLEGISSEEGPHDLESNVRLLNNIRIKLLEHKTPNILKDSFERADQKNTGLLDPATFKTCLLNLRDDLNITIGQINKLSRYIEKNNGMLINYYGFLKMLNTELINLTLKESNNFNKDSLYDIENLALDIKGYLKEHNINSKRFLLRAMNQEADVSDEELQFKNTNMRVNLFANFICSQIYSTSEVSDITISYYINKIDIDQDGFINSEDLDIFLSRYNLLESKKDRLAETLYNTMLVDATVQLEIQPKKSLFPVKQVKASKIDVVLRDLRQALGSKNVSFREFFTKLDSNKDGLITYDEFRDGLVSLYPFSEEVVKGLFAFMDRQHIGMIDFNNYLKVMKKSVLDDMNEGAEDNFDWQISIIQRLKEWFFSQDLTTEDAFRMIDTDFDNQINKIDLRRFMQTVL